MTARRDDTELARYVRKNIPSAQRIEGLRALGLLCDRPEDRAEVDSIVDFLLLTRQYARGGRLNPYGSRHWNDGNNPHGED
jgi:hypothetical protein